MVGEYRSSSRFSPATAGEDAIRLQAHAGLALKEHGGNMLPNNQQHQEAQSDMYPEVATYRPRLPDTG